MALLLPPPHPWASEPKERAATVPAENFMKLRRDNPSRYLVNQSPVSDEGWFIFF
jgi:hypothetical protein